MSFLNLHEAEAVARAPGPAATVDAFVGGACDEVTLAENRRAFDAIALRYHVLTDVSRRELGTTLLDQPVTAPIVVAPLDFQRLAAPRAGGGGADGLPAAGASGRRARHGARGGGARSLDDREHLLDRLARGDCRGGPRAPPVPAPPPLGPRA